jgi:hypothetical protein
MEEAARRLYGGECERRRRRSGELINFHDTSGLDDRRFLLPLGKLLRAVAINIDASKLFTVRVVHGDLPVMVLTPLVATHAAGLLELGFFHDEWGPPHEGLWQVYEGRASNKLGVNVPILYLRRRRRRVLFPRN